METNISKNQLSYIYKAMEEAQKSPLRCKHGCVIVRSGRIVASGYNKYHGTSGINHKRSIHAEEDAINSCKRSDMKGAKLYVVRFNINTNETSNSKPCHNCQQLINVCIKKYKLKSVHYTAEVNISFND